MLGLIRLDLELSPALDWRLEIGFAMEGFAIQLQHVTVPGRNTPPQFTVFVQTGTRRGSSIDLGTGVIAERGATARVRVEAG